MKRAIITVGMGFGDEGKGATVDYLCRKYDAGLVVRYCGGHQAGHHVELPDGKRHEFSQFGAGTLAGVPTFLAHTMIVEPAALFREADHLASLFGRSVLGSLTVHPDCLVTTPFHRAVNIAREEQRGSERHGSCRVGVGVTREYWLKYGEDALRMGDFDSPVTVLKKLELLRQRLLQWMSAENVPISADSDLLNMSLLEVKRAMGKIADIRLALDVHSQPDMMIFEGAQGVLLDEFYGFHPHTTWSCVTPRYAVDFCCRCDEVAILGVTRAYLTRHGDGPMPTGEVGAVNIHADWKRGNEGTGGRGSIRAGALDIPLLDYAVRACGRWAPQAMAVTCLDHLPDRSSVLVCHNYAPFDKTEILLPTSQKHSEEMMKALRTARPKARMMNPIEAVETIRPVSISSFGPTHLDRREFGTLKFQKL